METKNGNNYYLSGCKLYNICVFPKIKVKIIKMETKIKNGNKNKKWKQLVKNIFLKFNYMKTKK